MGKRLNTYSFIEESKIKHNDTYYYNLSDYINSRAKINILCSVHGLFEQSPHHHLQGQGCPKCAIRRKPDTLELFIKKANVIHNDVYDYNYVDYKNNNSKIKM